MALSIGQQARLVQPVIEGEITDIRYNKDAAELEYLINYTTADGDHSRWFVESALEVK